MKLIKSTIAQAVNLNGFENGAHTAQALSVNRPLHRPKHLDGIGRMGSVLLLVYQQQGEPYTVLTRRQTHLANHAGQISLPGGRQNQNEPLSATAVREAEEEIGVGSSQIELLGKLNSIYIPPSDFTVTPFVGWAPHSPQFVQQESEVAEIIELPLSELLDGPGLEFGEIRDGNRTLLAPHYRIGNNRIWGATAAILCDFLIRVQSLEHQ